MQIQVKGYGMLRHYIPTSHIVDLTLSGRVADLLASLGLSASQLWMMRVNGSNVTAEFELHDGDLVEFIPPIGGG